MTTTKKTPADLPPMVAAARKPRPTRTDLTGFWLARRDTRWDPYPHDDGERVLVHVTRWGRGEVWITRCARHGFEWPVPLVLCERAHGVAGYGRKAGGR